MKSTGLFGKNSGRVGGVVYSNYRGEQIVRSYQPKVKNPSTAKQVAQRAKFKLISQVAASLGRELNASFVPHVAKETGRNAFVKAMLRKAVYSANQASLPIEDVVLTNSIVNGFFELTIGANGGGGILSPAFGVHAKVRVVYIAYSEGGHITRVSSVEPQIQLGDTGLRVFTLEPIGAVPGFSNVRALVYAYEPDQSSGTSYDDYEVLGDEATLEDVLRVYSGRVRFSETRNIAVPQNV